MKIQPLGENVLLRPLQAEEKTASGLVLPTNTLNNREEAEIIALGEYAGEELSIGDKVIYSKFAGIEVTNDGVTYYIVTVDDIVAKLC